MKRWFAALIFIGAFCFRLPAQTRPVIKILPFSIEGIGADEGLLLESLIHSYLADIGEVINYFPMKADSFVENQSVIDSWTKIPNYTVSGSVHLDKDNRVLRMDVGDMAAGTVNSYSYSYKSAGELALKTRSMLENAFPAEKSPERRQNIPLPENINENRVMGSWRGETGIEMVRLHRGGRGTAVFSSGAQMALAYVIENNTLKVRQVSPNSDRYYHPLPQETAKKIAAGAEPMTWELKLYERGSALRGLKSFTGLRTENDSTELVQGETLEIEWIRTSH
jgi:hypothetical protein